MEFKSKAIFFYFFVAYAFLVVLRMGYVSFIMDPITLRSRIKIDRGDILDRNGKILATSVPRYNIYLNNKKKPKLPVKKITSIMGLPLKWTNSLQENRVFLLKKYLNDDDAKELKKLGEEALLFERVAERVHPYKDYFSTTIGIVDRQSLGVSGLEKSMDTFLSSVNLPIQNVVTTIDIDLQIAVEKSLIETILEFNADQGMVLVQDISSAKILSMASLLNPNDSNYQSVNLLNPNVSQVLEPGSILKVFFIAYLLENKFYSLKQTFKCRGSLRLVGGETVKCTGVHGDVNFNDIMRYSCNSAIIQATDIVSRKGIYDFLYHCRFGHPTGIRLPSEAKSIIREPKDWGIRTTATIPIGHGIALTPIQIISSFSALLNKGVYTKPSIIQKVITKEISPKTNVFTKTPSKRIFSPSTSEVVTDLLGYGTMSDATGRKARYGEYTPIGKTGTSQLVNFGRGGGYLTNSYNAIFMGAYPKKNARFSVLVIINNPKLSHYGGEVAAPLFSSLLPDLFTAYGLTREIPKWIDNVSLHSQTHSLRFKNHLMPNFKDKSLRDVLINLQKMRKVFRFKNLSFEVVIKGRGLVVDQNPLPGNVVKDKSTITIYLK